MTSEQSKTYARTHRAHAGVTVGRLFRLLDSSYSREGIDFSTCLVVFSVSGDFS